MAKSSKPKPKPIVVNSDTGFPELEAALSAMSSSSSAGRDLLLATNWKIDSRPGGSAAAAQLLISWSRYNPQNKLVTHIKDPGDQLALQGLTSRMHGLIVTAMANQIVARNSVTRVDSELYRHGHNHLQQTGQAHWYNFRRGPELGLLCVDHWPDLNFPRQLYNVTERSIEVKNQAAFEDLAFELLLATGSIHNKLITGVSALGQMLFELFSNTDRHARSNENDEVYPRSVRGIVVAHRRVPLALMSPFSSGVRALRLYLDALQTFVSGEALNLAEFSLFDSGPGYVRRMSPGVILDELSGRLEREIVRRCFLKNITSTTSRGRGKGLTRVLQILKERGGLIRIRTGRLSLFQFFNPAAKARSDSIVDADIVLRDTDTLEEEPTVKGRTEGTTITILIPVGLRLP